MEQLNGFCSWKYVELVCDQKKSMEEITILLLIIKWLIRKNLIQLMLFIIDTD